MQIIGRPFEDEMVLKVASVVDRDSVVLRHFQTGDHRITNADSKLKNVVLCSRHPRVPSPP